MAQTLHGSCACTRNKYTISIPVQPSLATQPQILIDTSAHSRAIHASPIPLLLRFPTPWLETTTHSFFPDETHQSIRKTYSSPFSPVDSLSSVFCGYCGTQLYRWDASNRESDAFVCVTVGSLQDGEVEKYFGNESVIDPDTEEEETKQSAGEESQTARLRGAEWFEDLLGAGAGSSTTKGPLGRIARLGVRERGGGVARVVEWEIVEWSSAAATGAEEIEKTGSAGKRKADILTE